MLVRNISNMLGFFFSFNLLNLQFLFTFWMQNESEILACSLPDEYKQYSTVH